MGDIAAEVERRRDEETDTLAPIYLLIYDIQRFRDLRKGDDDFGFSSSFGEDKPASPSKSFTTILKDGPAVAVHTLVWCDSVNNLNRTFDRQGLKEFEIRVLFQMSANDQQLADRFAGRRQARCQSGPLLQRGREPDREVPPLRPARPAVARPRQPPVPGPTHAGASRGSKRRWKW